MHAGLSDDLWRNGYRLNEDMRPSFISKQMAGTILRAGKSINFLRYHSLQACAGPPSSVVFTLDVACLEVAPSVLRWHMLVGCCKVIPHTVMTQQAIRLFCAPLALCSLEIVFGEHTDVIMSCNACRQCSSEGEWINGKERSAMLAAACTSSSYRQVSQ